MQANVAMEKPWSSQAKKNRKKTFQVVDLVEFATAATPRCVEFVVPTGTGLPRPDS
jgi:hypothetical protein